jgi:hypothetical protein
MKVTTIRLATDIYNCANDFKLSRRRCQHQEFRRFCLDVQRIKRDLGEDASEVFWRPFMRRVGRYRFDLNAAPLPFNHSSVLPDRLDPRSDLTRRVQLENFLRDCEIAFGQGVVYFTGAESEAQYSGIDADIVILDEFDLMAEEVLSIAQARLRSSRSPRIVVTSTPTISDFGVSSLYDASDQRHYELSCPHCETWQEPQFPESVDRDKQRVVCSECRGVLDPWHTGRWTAKKPESGDVRGYQLNRLVLPSPPLGPMKLALEGTIPTTKEMFHRQDLGQPYSSPDSRLTPEILNACIEPWCPAAPLKVNVMGIDVGRKLHVVIRGRVKERWYLLEAFTADTFEELEACFKCYEVTACVVDALPETREARRFQERHRGVVWLSQYLVQGIDANWDWVEGVVKAPRTVVMDEMMRRFRDREFVLPDSVHEIEGGEYFWQLQAPARVVDLDKWGQPFASYVHRKADDFAHAEVYATLAAIRAHLSGAVMWSVGWDPRNGIHITEHTRSDYRDQR